MARWDQIFSLPVQNPTSSEFSALDLVWSKVEGSGDKIDRVARIPYARISDFVRGESANKDCPTSFHVEARRRPKAREKKQKVDGIVEYILYWCSFGPDDNRTGGVVRPSRNLNPPKNKKAGRPNSKRGCRCRFIVKCLMADPSVALIIYNHDKHVDEKGLPCHGPQDQKSTGTRAMYAPYISENLKLRVLSLLYVGVSVETIMQRHNESVEKQGGPSNRDDLLTHRSVRRLERTIRRSTYELDEDDDISISMWVESHQSHVFFFEDFSDSGPLTLGIQSEWQLQQMIRFGNCSLIASHSRFGTNKLKYPVHSLVVFDSENKAIPVAWVITPRLASGDAYRWMRALYNRVLTKDPSWKLAGFIVDDPSADVLSIRDVFQCTVLVSLWRVRHLWHKNIINRCAETEVQANVLRRLGHAIDEICNKRKTVAIFEDFMEDFVDSSSFVEYFRAVWYPRIGAWTTSLQSLPLASLETSAAMEFYHFQLKRRLLNERDPGVCQRADWLVDKLGTEVHSYFWLDSYSGKEGFSRYWKDEWISGLTSFRRAMEIPDSDVVVAGKSAKVTDPVDRDKAYVVQNPGSQFGICSCSWAEVGYLCEHIIKVIKICRRNGSVTASTSIIQYYNSLMEMFLRPPHDSVIRDYAVSLAVCVEKQLSAFNFLQNGESDNDLDMNLENSCFKNLFSDQFEADGLIQGERDVDQSPVSPRGNRKGNVSIKQMPIEVDGSNKHQEKDATESRVHPDGEMVNETDNSRCFENEANATESTTGNGNSSMNLENSCSKNLYSENFEADALVHCGMDVDRSPVSPRSNEKGDVSIKETLIEGDGSIKHQEKDAIESRVHPDAEMLNETDNSRCFENEKNATDSTPGNGNSSMNLENSCSKNLSSDKFEVDGLVRGQRDVDQSPVSPAGNRKDKVSITQTLIEGGASNKHQNKDAKESRLHPDAEMLDETDKSVCCENEKNATECTNGNGNSSIKLRLIENDSGLDADKNASFNNGEAETVVAENVESLQSCNDEPKMEVGGQKADDGSCVHTVCGDERPLKRCKNEKAGESESSDKVPARSSFSEGGSDVGRSQTDGGASR